MLIGGQHTSTVSLHALHVPSAGISNQERALQDLYYHTLASGIGREIRADRIALPQSLQFTKDAEQPGSDRLLLANIEERLSTLFDATYQRRFTVDQLDVLDSKANLFLQVADLFAAAIRRMLNTDCTGDSPKDTLAREFYDHFGLEQSKLSDGGYSDLVSVDSL